MKLKRRSLVNVVLIVGASTFFRVSAAAETRTLFRKGFSASVE